MINTRYEWYKGKLMYELGRLAELVGGRVIGS